MAPYEKKSEAYTEKVMEHFKNPKDMGEMKNPNGVGQVGNPICGDVMKVAIKVGKNEKNQEIIKDIKFKTMGCVAAIATSSMITEIAKGKTLEEAKKIDRKDVSEYLGGLPPIKEHCSNLAADALHKAIKDYEKNRK